MSNKSARLLGGSMLTAAATATGIALVSALVWRRDTTRRWARLAATREEIRQWIVRAGGTSMQLDVAPARSQNGPQETLDFARARQAFAQARLVDAEAAKLEMEVAEMCLPPSVDRTDSRHTDTAASAMAVVFRTIDRRFLATGLLVVGSTFWAAALGSVRLDVPGLAAGLFGAGALCLTPVLTLVIAGVTTR